MSAPHRLRDLADVLELIRSARLPAEFAQSGPSTSWGARRQIDPSVRDKYRELWQDAQTDVAE
jgi:hypothetical protein